MIKTKPKILVILGQTATGKSGYAVKVAKKLNGEIISADSRQIYRDLNIGSGKITKREMKGISHHLLDVADPKKQFSVVEYQTLAAKAIEDILSRGKLPIIVGGTGFYIDALVHGNILPEVPPNKKLRTTLLKKSALENFATLQKLDLKRAKTIDRQNNVRLVRAIEIAKALGKVPKIKTVPKYDAKIIGLTLPDETLKKNIHTRLLARMKQGMVAEVKNLHTHGLSWRRLEELGLEYRHIAQYLQVKLTKQQMLADLENAIWQYAKRQKTWFKRDRKITWINQTETKDSQIWKNY